MDLSRALAEGLLDLSVRRSLKMVEDSLNEGGIDLPTDAQLEWVIAGIHAGTAQTIGILSDIGLLGGSETKS